MHFHQTKTKSQTKFPPPHHPSKQINTKTSPPPTPPKKNQTKVFQKYPSLKGPELERVGCLVPCLGSKLIGKIDAEGERWWNHVSIFKCICVFMICLFVFNYMCFGIYIYICYFCCCGGFCIYSLVVCRVFQNHCVSKCRTKCRLVQNWHCQPRESWPSCHPSLWSWGF